MNENQQLDLAGQVIGLAMKVHRTLGPGFLESVYQNALSVELERAGMSFERGRPLSVSYEGVVVGDFTPDITIEGSLILELKAVSALARVHEVQLVNYLTATGVEDGLLLNFGAANLEFKRKYRTYRPAKEKNLIL